MQASTLPSVFPSKRTKMLKTGSFLKVSAKITDKMKFIEMLEFGLTQIRNCHLIIWYVVRKNFLKSWPSMPVKKNSPFSSSSSLASHASFTSSSASHESFTSSSAASSLFPSTKSLTSVSGVLGVSGVNSLASSLGLVTSSKYKE